jgi:hypothetical protein
MDDERNIQREEHARQYLRSKWFRVCSWSSAALVAAFFLIRNHRVWYLYPAAALSFAAMVPVLRVIRYNDRIDFQSQRDRRFLLFVALYVSLIVVGAFLFVYFAKR